ncbi:MAG: alcohol dehydrogenase catalytic domain-containing protein [Alphaproteobacteria bacterium]|nr:alcohol dehydrogenase catalytic domain-containing protein [Alphaproteobacteria bacterium]
MRAVRLHGIGDLRVEEVADPPAPDGDGVRLAVEAAGICGSDLHNFRTGIWMSRLPSTPGHELVATVEAVGPAVTGLSVGDRVVADSRVPCGTCPACRAGRSYLCPAMGFVGEVNDGGFAPTTVLPEHQVLRLPDPGVPARVAALAEPLAVALHAVNRLAPPAGAACQLPPGDAPRSAPAKTKYSPRSASKYDTMPVAGSIQTGEAPAA